jgi:hypothetical protein
MTRTGRLGALAALLVVGTLLAPSAGAVEPARQGWWRASVVILGIDLTALLDPSTADVPADGLLVAGGSAPDQPQAIAAVAYEIAGTVAGPLRLAPHTAAATVPGSGAMACPLDEPAFTPAQGGPIAEAPRYDCLGAVVATVDADGAYLFDVSTLVRGSAVAVAILPTTPASRIVFAAPADGSLAITPDGAAAPAPSTGDPVGAAPSAGPVDRPSVTVAGTSAAAPDSPPVAAGLEGADPSPVAAIGSAPATAARGSAARAYVLLAIATAAGLAWARAGRRRPQRATA